MNLKGLVGETLGHVLGAPARVAQKHHHLVAPTLGIPTVVKHAGVHLHIGPQRVPTVERFAGAINARLLGVFFFKAAKQAVPHHPNAGVVAVQVFVVHGMVNTVVGGRAKPAVKPPQAANVFGMHPILVKQIDQRHDAKHHRRHAHQSHRQIKHPTADGASAALAQRGGQVVVLALVVHRMSRPKHGYLVAGAVKPVIAKVIQNQCQHNAIPSAPPRVIAHQSHLFKHQGVNTNAQHTGEDGADLAQYAQRDAADGVV